MSYRTKHGITNIRDSLVDNLVISRDYDFNPKKTYPVLLFTPAMTDTNTHYHVPLSRGQARKLRNWLDQYLNDPRVKK